MKQNAQVQVSHTLVAAAPDLLNALEVFTDRAVKLQGAITEQGKVHATEVLFRTIGQARAAIQKARGEA